jgi:hypothetical protein
MYARCTCLLSYNEKKKSFRKYWDAICIKLKGQCKTGLCVFSE